MKIDCVFIPFLLVPRSREPSIKKMAVFLGGLSKNQSLVS